MNFQASVRRVAMLAMLSAALGGTTFWLGPQLLQTQQVRLANRLAARIQEGNSRKCRVLLRQLAGLETAAVEALVIAAAAEQADVALIAREIIDEKLASWKAKAEVDPTFDLAGSIHALVDALALHIQEFGDLGKQWAQSIAMEAVKLSGDMSAREAEPVLASSSRIIKAVSPVGPRMRTSISTQATMETSNLSAFQSVQPDLQTLAGSREHFLPRSTPSERSSPTTPTPSLDPETPREVQPTPIPGGSQWVPEWSGNRSSTTYPPTDATNLNRLAIEPPSQDYNEPVVNVPSPAEMADLTESLRNVSPRELFAELAKANFYRAGAIRTVLGERGFARQEFSLGEHLTSPDPAVRLQLIPDLGLLPARTARRWLRELLGDDIAEIRLAALTALATSQDPELIQLAREIAVRDSDPRVADLATRIVREAR